MMKLAALPFALLILASCSQKNSESNEAGASLYAKHCATCHQANGMGAAPMNPPLAKTSYVLGDKTELVRIVLHGMQGQKVDGKTYHNPMPAFDYLADAEIASILTYVRSNFGNQASAITEAEVKSSRETGN